MGRADGPRPCRPDRHSPREPHRRSRPTDPVCSVRSHVRRRQYRRGGDVEYVGRLDCRQRQLHGGHGVGRFPRDRDEHAEQRFRVVQGARAESGDGGGQPGGGQRGGRADGAAHGHAQGRQRQSVDGPDDHVGQQQRGAGDGERDRPGDRGGGGLGHDYGDERGQERTVSRLGAGECSAAAPAAPATGGNPNEPAGFQRFAENDFTVPMLDHTAPTGLLGLWRAEILDSDNTYVADGAAPKSPLPVFQGKYPAGWTAGYSPIKWEGWDGAANSLGYGTEMAQMYLSLWIRFPGADYENQSVGTKFFYLGDRKSVV